MRKQQGLTLYELMITVTIAAILLAIAVPSFDQVLQNSRTTSQVNELVANLQIARSEAVTRGSPVTVGHSGTDWSDPVELRADVNEDGDITDAEDLIFQLDFVSSATLAAEDEDGNAVSSVEFGASGFTNQSVTFTYTADDCKNANRRVVSVGLSGIVSSSKAACP